MSTYPAEGVSGPAGGRLVDSWRHSGATSSVAVSLYAAIPSSRSSLAVSERFENEWREQKSRSFELTDTSPVPTQTRLFCLSGAFCCKGSHSRSIPPSSSLPRDASPLFDVNLLRRPTRHYKVLLVHAMDTSVFAEYETDLQTLLGSISAQLDGDAVRLRGGAYPSPRGGLFPTLTRPGVYRRAKERVPKNRTRARRGR